MTVCHCRICDGIDYTCPGRTLIDITDDGTQCPACDSQVWEGMPRRTPCPVAYRRTRTASSVDFPDVLVLPNLHTPRDAEPPTRVNMLHSRIYEDLTPI